MKEKIFNPASTNDSSPAEGMAAVNTFDSEEIDDNGASGEQGMPKNFERDQKKEQRDDTHSANKE
jgi:hypothetical protein